MLSDKKRKLAAAILVVAIPPLLGLGCQLLVRLTGPSRPSFSHARHVVEKKLDCLDCHGDYETGEKAGMPVMEVCSPCHAGKDNAKPPLERADAYLVNGEPLWSAATRVSEEIVFSHQLHHEKGVACGECHRDVEKSAKVTSRLAIGKPECMDCHAKKGASNECSACHREIRKEKPPDDHRFNWQVLHGQTVRSGREDRSLCGLCHGEEQCSGCHQEQAPRSHTNFWRQQGHGISVRIDRESCRTCHQVDFCDRCHSETAPRSHRGSFAAPLHRHCLTCHTPLSGEQCAVCHKSTSSHDLAPPKPSWHTPAMNCRQCHVAGSLFMHVDNGDNCNGCHS